MRITGLAAEFNPFHNGHAYILNRIKERSDAAVVVMSGSFVQRGDIAVTDKHTRARIALENGADLVVELPVIYALNSARRFAAGAVKTLDAMGVVGNIAFGSECGDIERLGNAAYAAANETAEVSEKIKTLISSGMSYPAAQSTAYKEFSDIWSKPNNILAAEYMRALLEINSSIEPFTIKRTNDFHSLAVSGDIISASAVRELMARGEDTSEYMPETEFDIYSLDGLDNILTYKLRTSSAAELAAVNDVSEGLENRIIASAAKNAGFEAISRAVKSKRYTMSRIRRILLGTVIGLDKELCSREPSYIRVLGMNDTGRRILKGMKGKARLPVIVKTADYKADDIWRAELRATEAAALCRVKGAAPAGRDYLMSPVIIPSSPPQAF